MKEGVVFRREGIGGCFRDWRFQKMSLESFFIDEVELMVL